MTFEAICDSPKPPQVSCHMTRGCLPIGPKLWAAKMWRENWQVKGDKRHGSASTITTSTTSNCNCLSFHIRNARLPLVVSQPLWHTLLSQFKYPVTSPLTEAQRYVINSHILSPLLASFLCAWWWIDFLWLGRFISMLAFGAQGQISPIPQYNRPLPKVSYGKCQNQSIQTLPFCCPLDRLKGFCWIRSISEIVKHVSVNNASRMSVVKLV